jgi:zinc transport system substrate-binding protein
MKHLILKAFHLFTIVVILFACNSGKKQVQEKETMKIPVVAVVNYPLYSFATQIGGDKVDIFFPEIDGDPAYWEPDETSIEKFQSADLILLNGADYAKWTEKVSLPSSTQINTAIAFKDQWIEIKGEVHSHGPEGEHSHTGYAFTTWLDMKNAEKHAEAVYEALVKLLPEERASLESNFKEVRNQIQHLDSQLSEILGEKQDLELFASHPVYQYLANGYDVDIVSYHWEPDQMPSEVNWQEFEHDLDHHSARAMLWEDEPVSEIRQKLEEVGVTVIVFNPGGNKSDLDFISLMRQNIDNLKARLE